MIPQICYNCYWSRIYSNEFTKKGKTLLLCQQVHPRRVRTESESCGHWKQDPKKLLPIQRLAERFNELQI